MAASAPDTSIAPAARADAGADARPARWTPPTVRWVSCANGDEVPPGQWGRNTHHRVPITPLYADYALGSHRSATFEMLMPAFEAAWATACGVPTPPPSLPRLWTPLEDNEWLIVDGYAYTEKREGPRMVRPGPDANVLPVVDRWERQVRPAVEARLDAFLAKELVALSDAALLEELRDRSRLAAEVWGHYGAIAWSDNLTRTRFQRFCAEHLGLDEAGWVQLLTGASGGASEPVEQLEEIARRIAASPTLRAALESTDPWSDSALRALVDPYVAAQGHRTSGWEYYPPTLAEQPERVLTLLREALARVESGTAGATAEVRRRRDALVAELRAKLPAAQQSEFDHLLALNHRTYDGNERGVVLYHHAAGVLRYAILEAGRRLTGHGLLSERDRVFFLRLPELEDALAGSPVPDLFQRAEDRHAAYQRQWNETPPDTFGAATSAAPVPVADASAPATAAPAEQTVRGLGASPGVYEGTARVILTERDFERVQPGDVLVCPITSPPWTVLFGRIGALVTDIGGLLSHPAIASREFGIPAVLGTRRATKTIQDGQRLRVDGATGAVTVLSA
jgi:rifampicin phosphotransferase